MGHQSRRQHLTGLAALSLASPGAALAQARAPALYFLNLGGRVMRAGLDGSGAAAIVTQTGVRGHDGIGFDPVGRRLYWTTMGVARENDGAVYSAALDGSDLKTVVPPGGTFTPKQLKVDERGRKLYWSDREGMRVMRANLDGSQLETLVVTGQGDEHRRDPSRWCVGISVDPVRGHVYWTQKGGDNAGTGSIRRAPIDLKGQDPAARRDVEVLFSSMPEPIDLDLDLERRLLYWTDRGDNTVNRAPMDPPRSGAAGRTDRGILVRGAGEAIGIALDLPGKRMFYTSLGGEVATASIDGAGARTLLTGQGTLTGIVLAA